MAPPPPPGDYRAPATTTNAMGFRSNSAIDVHAARRAQARAKYSSINRMKAGAGVSLREYFNLVVT